jgi:diguanylate cyclase (GGDEF)-like protein/PAS domain S-box-containing protein
MARPPEPIAVLTAVLLVEDDEDDYLITREMLAGQDRARFVLDWCATYDDALNTIRERRHDVYLIDYQLGEHTGLELLREGFGTRTHAPVIVLTGQGGYEIDLDASALGVMDYLVKQELDPAGLERSIRYAITHQRALNELARSQERYALAVSATNDGIWDWDLETDVIYFSPRWHAILGRRERSREAPPSAWFELVHERDLPRLRAAIDAHLAGQTPHLQSEHRMRHVDGTWRWVLTRGLAIRRPGGGATRIAGSVSDITDQRAVELQLQHDALHDALTGLPNRALFMDRVDQVVRRSTRDPAVGCAVLFLDVDGFKLVNDTLSHAAGDQLLIEIAARIAEMLRPGDTFARIGGDEFTILLDGVVVDRDATVIAERVQGSLGRPFALDGHEIRVTTSIGVSLSSPGMSAAELLRNSDIAMYDAKRRGHGRCAVFTEAMRQRVIDRVRRENDLRQAVEESLLTVHYQPIVDLASGAIYGIEALARWPDRWPELAPTKFIEIAEETGVIGAVGRHVMRVGLERFAAWRRAGLVSEEVRVSVNVSGHQLEDPHLPQEIRDAIEAAELPATALRLEITESTLMQEPERIRRIVSEVCASGVGLHLDDFGTGYSSLAALHRLPVDALKIDRSFVTSAIEDGSDAIVRAIVALAHSLGIDVIAEGIERPEQGDRLRALGCRYGQGFLFSRPLGAEEMEAALLSWSPPEAAALGIE